MAPIERNTTKTSRNRMRDTENACRLEATRKERPSSKMDRQSSDEAELSEMEVAITTALLKHLI